MEGILNWISKKQYRKVWTGFLWFRMGAWWAFVNTVMDLWVP
jgi:hypothetical protein